MNVQAAYQQAILYAAQKHVDQTIPGTSLSYVVHLSNVAMEILVAAQYTEDFDVTFAVQVALLHDVLEDTNTTFDELAVTFSYSVAEGVAALTKNKELPKAAKMQDSLERIKMQRKEVWAVKLADRITNLQTPPQHWSLLKKKEYLQEAVTILTALKDGNQYLSNGLEMKIAAYEKYTL